MEEKLIEEEVARRVDAIVKQRVEEELSRRQDEIEAEVARRVEEAKQEMEKQMLIELEKQKQERIEEQKRQEVKFAVPLATHLMVSHICCDTVDECSTITGQYQLNFFLM